MARKSRKNTPIAVTEPTDNLTTKAGKTISGWNLCETFIRIRGE